MDNSFFSQTGEIESGAVAVYAGYVDQDAIDVSPPCSQPSTRSFIPVKGLIFVGETLSSSSACDVLWFIE